MKWRTGRTNGHTIYTQNRAEPQDDDLFIGSMVHPDYAIYAVRAVNTIAQLRQLHRSHATFDECVECSNRDSVPWPCPTMQIVEGEQTQTMVHCVLCASGEHKPEVHQ